MIETTADSSRVRGYENVCQLVVKEVAATLDVRPRNLDQTLNEAIDPDALAKLFEDRGPGTDRRVGRVEFDFAGCLVSVRSTGDVSVTPDSGHRTPTRGA